MPVVFRSHRAQLEHLSAMHDHYPMRTVVEYRVANVSQSVLPPQVMDPNCVAPPPPPLSRAGGLARWALSRSGGLSRHVKLWRGM